MCELLVGLPAINVLSVDELDGTIVVGVESRTMRPGCAACGTPAWVKDRPIIELVDLPCFGRPARLVWCKHRWRCPDVDCEMRSWTGEDQRIAPARAAMTDRAGRWVCEQVGRAGRTVAEVARELGCDWHTVNDAVIAYGTPLVEDPARIGDVDALGLDETLFCRAGRWRTQQWCTSILDVSAGNTQLLDVVAGRTAAGPSGWLEARPDEWRAAIRFGVLDLSGPYRKTFEDSLDHVTQVADPFHLVKLANSKLDECRRRVQNETVGHRAARTTRCTGRAGCSPRRMSGSTSAARPSCWGCSKPGDPRGEVRTAWHAKEVVRSIYEITDAETAGEFVDQLGVDLQDESCPAEVRSLGRTIVRWRDQIVAWHRAFVTNGPTEAVNNLIKRIKRIGFGFRRLSHYRIRVLLYAGKPNWDLLATVTPR